MFLIILKKEIKYNFTSPRFISLFLISSILIILSFITGIQEFKYSQKKYQEGINLLHQDLNERTSWSGIETKAFREPNPMQIFSSGISNDIGRYSGISQWSNIKLQNSNYEDETLFAFFRSLDFVFIIQIVFSLIAILMTYDGINGERETGTLKLILASGVSRTTMILTKLTGNIISIILPLSIPLLLGVLTLILLNIPLSAGNWMSLLVLLLLSFLYIIFFQTMGIFVSSLTRTSSNSFLILLIIWIFLVLILPGSGIMMAGQLVPVPSIAEIESQREAFEKDQWNDHERALSERWRKRNLEMKELDSEEHEAYQDARMWEWMQEDDALRKNTQQIVAEFSRKQNEELRNKREQRERTGFFLARFSPAAIYVLSAMDLCESDTELKSRTEISMQNFQGEFNKFIEKKQEENDGNAGFRITMDTDRGFSFTSPDMLNTIEASEIPQYSENSLLLAGVMQNVILGLGLMILSIGLIFALTFFTFNRYDVR